MAGATDDPVPPMTLRCDTHAVAHYVPSRTFHRHGFTFVPGKPLCYGPVELLGEDRETPGYVSCGACKRTFSAVSRRR